MYRVGTYPPRLEVLETLPVVHSREVCRCCRHLSLEEKKSFRDSDLVGVAVVVREQRNNLTVKTKPW